MFIKKVIDYSYNYATYIVSDGIHEIKCMCLSVPLPNNKEPLCGMEVIHVYAFSLDKIKIKKVVNERLKTYHISRSKIFSFEHKLRGKIIDSKLSLVEVFGFIISLEFDYEYGLSDELKDGDYIEFKVDRLDCEII